MREQRLEQQGHEQRAACQVIDGKRLSRNRWECGRWENQAGTSPRFGKPSYLHDLRHVGTQRSPMAFLRKRAEWWCVVWKEGRVQRSKKVSKNREIAKAALRRHENEGDRARSGLGAGDSWLAEACQAHYGRLEARVAAGDLAPATEVRAREAMAAFLVWLQEQHPKVRRVGQVTREVLSSYQLARAAHVKAKTVNTEMSLISPLFRRAVQDGQLQVNPFEGIRRLRERDSIPAKQLTPPQVAALLKAAKKVDPELLPYLAGYVYTGARRSELFAVAWADVDLDGGILRLPNIKTSRGADDRDRPVPIHPALAIILRKRRKLERPWPPILRHFLSNRFHRVTKAAGMPWLTRLHDLRHAFAGTLVSGGVSLYAVGELLGHRDPRTTKRYAALAPGALKEAVGKLKY